MRQRDVTKAEVERGFNSSEPFIHKRRLLLRLRAAYNSPRSFAFVSFWSNISIYWSKILTSSPPVVDLYMSINRVITERPRRWSDGCRWRPTCWIKFQFNAVVKLLLSVRDEIVRRLCKNPNLRSFRNRNCYWTWFNIRTRILRRSMLSRDWQLVSLAPFCYLLGLVYMTNLTQTRYITFECLYTKILQRYFLPLAIFTRSFTAVKISQERAS